MGEVVPQRRFVAATVGLRQLFSLQVPLPLPSLAAGGRGEGEKGATANHRAAAGGAVGVDGVVNAECGAACPGGNCCGRRGCRSSCS